MFDADLETIYKWLGNQTPLWYHGTCVHLINAEFLTRRVTLHNDFADKDTMIISYDEAVQYCHERE